MGVNCQGYQLKGSTWKPGQAHEADLGASDDKHAERAAYASFNGQATTYLFDQNDFPCEKCVSFFVKESIAGKNFVFKCTGNAGAYASESGFVDGSDVKRKFDKKLTGVIYMANGNIYAAGRKITVTKVKISGAAEKHVAKGQNDINAPVIPAVFTALPLYPDF